MPFPSINPGQVSALTASYIQDPGSNPAATQAMFTFGGSYLQGLIGGNNNLIWSNSGLTYDTDRNKILSVANGGHGDSGDNSVYEFDVDGTQTWSRKLSATYVAPGNLIPATPPNGVLYYTDTVGTFGAAGAVYAASRHSYMGNIYMPSVQKVWLAGGSPWGNSGGAQTDILWYDPVANSYALQAEFVPDGLGISAVWDPHLYRIVLHGQDRLRTYDPALAVGNRFANISTQESSWTSAAQTAMFDWRRRRYVMAGNHTGTPNGVGSDVGIGDGFNYYDLMANPNFATLQHVGVTGGMPTFPSSAEAPGLIYDQIRDRYIIWQGYTAGTANDLWSVDPDTFVATKLTFTGNTVPTTQGATWNRFLYNVQYDIYLLFNHWQQNCYAFRHPNQSRVFAMTNRTF